VPTFIPLADGAQVEIGFEWPGGLVTENRLWFVNRQPPTTLAQLQNLADGIATWHNTQIMPAISSEIELLSVIATKWDSAAGDIFAQSFVNSFGGNDSGCHSANVSIRVALAWSLRLNFLEENANFVGGIPLDQVDTNVYSEAIRGVLFEAYAALIDLAPVLGPFPAWRWVTTSRRVNNDWRSEQVSEECIGPRFHSPFISPRRRRITRLKKITP
jgi:hypothetical protein